MPILLLAGGALALFLFVGKGGSSAPAAPSKGDTFGAVSQALAHETDPAALLSFAASLLPDFPAEALALRKKAGKA